MTSKPALVPCWISLASANCGLRPIRVPVGQHRPGEVALHRAAIGVDEAEDDVGFEQAGGRLRVGQRHLGGGVTLIVGGADDAERLAIGLDGVVGAAEGEAWEGLERRHRPHHRVGLDRQVRSSGAVEIFGGDIDVVGLGRAERLVRRGGLEGKPLGLEVLDEEGDAVERRSARVGIEPHRPGAAHRVGVEGKGVEIAAGALVAEHDAALHDAVRPFDLHGQRQVVDRIRLRVAENGGEEHRFTRPVDAALGGGE